MDAICYVCNKQSTDIKKCKNLVKIKSQHSKTPISEFIRQFLCNFESLRNVGDESNCICIECLKQINDYDWMRQQASEKETKLRDLLLSTEILSQLSIKIEPAEFQEELGDCHNDLPPVSHQPTQLQQASLTSSVSNNKVNVLPAVQSNHAGAFVKISEPTVKQNRISIRKNCEYYKTDIKNQTHISHAVLQKGKDILDSTTTEPSSTHQNTPENGMATMKYERPVLSYACLIVMALKNSQVGSLSTSQICNFVCEHFPYFKAATESWKRGIRNNLSSNECFVKTKFQLIGGGLRSKNTWTINPSKVSKLDEEIHKWSSNYAKEIQNIMAVPENLPALLRGEMKYDGQNETYFEWDNCYHPSDQSATPIINSDENLHTEHNYDNDNDDVSDIFDEIDIDDSKPFQFEDCSYDNDSINTDAINLYEQFATLLPISRLSTLSPMLNDTSDLIEPPLQSNHISRPTAEKISKPLFSYTRLIAMALKNSRTGSLKTPEIYSFICEHFPYFRTAPAHWKNSVRHSLCQSSWFQKIQDHSKTNLWTVKPSKMDEMEREIQKLPLINSVAESNCMAIPENLPALLRGEMKHGNMNGICIEWNDSDDSEPENEPNASIINGEESHETECNVDASDVLDEIDIDDSKLFQFELDTENKNQNEFDYKDLQPLGKRARFDTD